MKPEGGANLSTLKEKRTEREKEIEEEEKRRQEETATHGIEVRLSSPTAASSGLQEDQRRHAAANEKFERNRAKSGFTESTNADSDSSSSRTRRCIRKEGSQRIWVMGNEPRAQPVPFAPEAARS